MRTEIVFPSFKLADKKTTPTRPHCAQGHAITPHHYASLIIRIVGCFLFPSNSSLMMIHLKRHNWRYTGQQLARDPSAAPRITALRSLSYGSTMYSITQLFWLYSTPTGGENIQKRRPQNYTRPFALTVQFSFSALLPGRFLIPFMPVHLFWCVVVVV